MGYSPSSTTSLPLKAALLHNAVFLLDEDGLGFARIDQAKQRGTYDKQSIHYDNIYMFPIATNKGCIVIYLYTQQVCEFKHGAGWLHIGLYLD